MFTFLYLFIKFSCILRTASKNTLHVVLGAVSRGLSVRWGPSTLAEVPHIASLFGIEQFKFQDNTVWLEHLKCSISTYPSSGDKFHKLSAKVRFSLTYPNSQDRVPIYFQAQNMVSLDLWVILYIAVLSMYVEFLWILQIVQLIFTQTVLNELTISFDLYKSIWFW